MKICIFGVWHLGAVTSACLASLGHNVVGFDGDLINIEKLNSGVAPLFEPGLDDLIVAGREAGFLSYTADIAIATQDIEVLWVTFDTPVNDEDMADVEYVLAKVRSILAHLPTNTAIIISSQLPVGSVAALEKFSAENHPDKTFFFSCIPENLRLGKALYVFLNPERLIVGVGNIKTKELLHSLLTSITNKLEWMSIESAEMTKHAINAFLAISVTFVNEIASVCELVGADAKEVERGLKTEGRIGPRAYLSPGGAFSGGTLARDIEFLKEVAEDSMLPIPLLNSVKLSNDLHKKWIRRKLIECFGSLQNTVVAVWGLTYKANTDTLRRSLSVELCDWLLESGAIVHVHDPVVKEFPKHWGSRVIKFASPFDAVEKAQVLVVGTEWPVYKEVVKKLLRSLPDDLLLIDANRYLCDYVDIKRIKYLAVGTPQKK